MENIFEDFFFSSHPSQIPVGLSSESKTLWGGRIAGGRYPGTAELSSASLLCFRVDLNGLFPSFSGINFYENKRKIYLKEPNNYQNTCKEITIRMKIK